MFGILAALLLGGVGLLILGGWYATIRGFLKGGGWKISLPVGAVIAAIGVFVFQDSNPITLLLIVVGSFVIATLALAMLLEACGTPSAAR
ncbi:hypothetical protein OG563_26710 [Nocardia vinacea]|uniref:DUF2207 domain-containing protein n=1 Tax=Nocardia vinacea TaxID=96468 RepID=A0ABZ1YIG6_9NOCA|nr:hypothetical protein [Nocardia vinacea]